MVTMSFHQVCLGYRELSEIVLVMSQTSCPVDIKGGLHVNGGGLGSGTGRREIGLERGNGPRVGDRR